LGHPYLINPAPSASLTQVTTKLLSRDPSPSSQLFCCGMHMGLSSSVPILLLCICTLASRLLSKVTKGVSSPVPVGLNLICCFACHAVCTKQIYGVASAEGAINCVHNKLIAIASCKTQEYYKIQ